jgi:outer membrane protein OmpA-like peptidoglycan-associated protein
MGTRTAEIDQRFAKVDATAEEQGQHINRVEAQASEAAQHVGEVRELATVGRERADAAFQKSQESDERFTRLWDNRHKRSTVETAEVLFGFDRWELADAAQNTLAEIAKEVKENTRLVVELAGYTDPIGTYEYNVQLSQRRVQAVYRFLVERGVELWRIDTVGLGPILDSGVSNDKKRRVTVTLLALE